MPELPDITIYLERLRAMVVGVELTRLRLGSPFVLRTVEPSPDALAGRTLEHVSRIGKRIVLSFGGDVHAVIHLMIAGRFQWKKPGASLASKAALAGFDFSTGTLMLTEAGTKRRASIHLVDAVDRLASFSRGGVDVQTEDASAFRTALRRQNRTLKRALTDPSIVDGVGNAYSDEILHRARQSPFKRTGEMSDAELSALYEAARTVVGEWIDRLRAEVADTFPRNVTAFRSEMAVHGKYGDPCPACGAPVQRIRYASNEANYCPGCQTGGRIYADRSLSRLLRDDWPHTLEELEDRPARPE